MSTPLYDPDDPRLTAYALGEATAGERAAVEQILAASPEARAAVEQTRILVRGLEEEYARENTAYQEAHPSPAVPVNIVPFPVAARGRWQPAAALMWKVAAAFVALCSLVWFAVQRTPPASVASVQPAARTATAPQSQTVAPTPVDRLEPAEKNDPLLAAAPNTEAQRDATTLEAKPSAPFTLAQVPPAAAAPAPPTLESTPMPADSSEAPGGTAGLLAVVPEPEARGRASQLDKARSVPSTDRAAQAPAAAKAPVLAAARPAPAPAALRAEPVPSMNDRLRSAVVRLRQPDGNFVGGVLLTTDGWVLSAAQPSNTDKPPRTTAVLADGREFVALPGGAGSSLNLLRVDAKALPTVRLATEVPGDGESLVTAHVDARTGATSLTRIQVKRADGQAYLDGQSSSADFVFNGAGELLAMEPALPAARSLARAQAAVRRPTSAPLLVRPFTARERASFAQPPR